MAKLVPVLFVVTIMWQIIPALQNIIKSSADVIGCSTTSSSLGETSQVVCLFPADVSTVTPVAINIEFYPNDARKEEEVLACMWLQGKNISCNLQEGYTLHGPVDAQLHLNITAMSEQHAGKYACKMMSPRVLREAKVTACTLKLLPASVPKVAAEDVSPAFDAVDDEVVGKQNNEAMEGSGTGIIVGIAVAAVVVAIIVVAIVAFVVIRRRKMHKNTAHPSGASNTNAPRRRCGIRVKARGTGREGTQPRRAERKLYMGEREPVPNEPEGGSLLEEQPTRDASQHAQAPMAVAETHEERAEEPSSPKTKLLEEIELSSNSIGKQVQARIRKKGFPYGTLSTQEAAKHPTILEAFGQNIEFEDN